VTALPAGTIRLQDVSKRYTKYEDSPTLAYGLLHAWQRSKRTQLWAVRDIDMSVEPGESVGIIGRNGSGKSTLLSMFCGVTAPTQGRLHVAGRIAPLISVGVGFHPELTGRENVYVNGRILGLKRQEIDRRLDSIIDFSEIEAFIDTPVKFYSSGMYVRLGFSVAAHVNPDVLLVDEVLAVGDQAFQWKCYKHMLRLREEGTTIVLVSHSMPTVERYCDRGVVLTFGRMHFDGPVSQAVESYHDLLSQSSAETRPGGGERLEQHLEAEAATILDTEGNERIRFDVGETVVLRVPVRVVSEVNAPYIGVSLIAESGVAVHTEHNLFDPFPRFSPGERRVLEARVELLLSTGSYTVEYWVGRGNQASRDVLKVADDTALLVPRRRAAIFVQGRPSARGLADLPTQFRLETTT
jgi:ABC-type polysaccharide/polyol phosphate transport system ATPase subunit